MKKISITIAIILCLYVSAEAQTIRFSGTEHSVWEESPEKSTGLDKIYALYSASGVSMSYEAAKSNKEVKWYKYDKMGGGYAEELIGIVKNGTTTTMPQVEGNCGYIIEEGDHRTYLWVVDYSRYYLNVVSIEPADEQDCGSIALNVSGEGDDIVYTTINGVSKVLSRDITLTYNSLEWNSENKQWEQKKVEKNYNGFKNSIYEIAPLCNTSFTLKGDRFLDFWGEGVTVSYDGYEAQSIDVQTVAEQLEREVPNEKKDGENSILGGSAPVDITFTAYPTDAVAQREWQMSKDPDFGTIESVFADDVYQETFTEAGTFYYRYVCKNSAGTCESISELYTVSIGESILVCPNAFSPTSTPGVNDEWRVQYKSIVSFKCWIFNRWGVQICELTDPSQGWDGKYKGKYVSSGVYYYVIQAEGADGKEYKLNGDINIINYKETENSTNNSGEGVIE
ncbi:MAG: gliding motility-associated C-terminal domain-containing protein [Bacteroidales bacterium]|nr:gliding motility-associated C-terminal domain-containing protein [Bacteroidales bacterium]